MKMISIHVLCNEKMYQLNLFNWFPNFSVQGMQEKSNKFFSRGLAFSLVIWAYKSS